MKRYCKFRFTLIELLVVIAIIAILAAMLLPALQQARERGKSAKCISNLKTFSAAVTAYCDNYKDFFPPPSMFSVSDEGVVGTGGNPYWHTAFAALNLMPGPPPNHAAAPKGIWACPSEMNGRLLSGVGITYKGTHYGLNRYLAIQFTSNSTTAARLAWRKITQARRPSVTCTVADKWFHPIRTSGTAQTEVRAYYYHPGERHSGRWNYATIDGGVKSRKDYPFRGASADWKDWLWAPVQW